MATSKDTAHGTSPVKSCEGLYTKLPGLGTITVNPMTGDGQFKLPIANLGSADGGAFFELALTSACNNPVLHLIPIGTWSQSFKLSGGADDPRIDMDYELDFDEVMHPDGRSIKAHLNNKGRTDGSDFVLDAVTFAKARTEYAIQQQRGSREATEAELENMTDAELKAHQEKYSHFKEIDNKTVGLIAKNGVVYEFECWGTGRPHSISNMLLTRVAQPRARALTFSWKNQNSDKPRLASINDGLGDLLSVTWTSDKKFQLAVYPNTPRAMTYDVSLKDNAWEIEVEGDDPLAENQVYRIDTTAGKINGIELKTKYGTFNNVDKVRVDQEVLTYKEGKILRHEIAMADKLDSSAHEYTYQTEKTTVVAKHGAEEVAKRTLEYKEGMQVAEENVVKGVTTRRRFSTEMDEKQGRITFTTSSKVGDNSEQKSEITLDALGNLVKLIEGDQIIEWSYFNNYRNFEVREWRVARAEKNIAAYIYRTLFGVINTDVAPIVFGSNSGLTSSVFSYSSVLSSVAACDYAKASFNLPVEINYPGDFDGLSVHVESQKVSRVVNGKPKVVQVTYFGYEKLPCKPRDGVSRSHIVVPTKKLTVLNPEIEDVDLTEIQHGLAKKGAADWFSLLDKQIDKAQSDDEKDAYKAQKSFLEESLKAQSKLNSKGFKLKNLNATNIQVEELTYYTDEESPAFGNVKSQTSYLIDKDGKEVEKSRKRTSIEHAADAEDKREHAITIKVKADKIELVSSQKRAGVDEHILQTQDSDGLQTHWVYGKNGLVASEQHKLGHVETAKIVYSTDLLDSGLMRYQVSDSESGDGLRVTFDGLGRECEVYRSRDGKAWLLWSQVSYDSKGRTSKSTEYDYDGVGKRLSSHETSWAFDKTKKNCTITKILRGGDNKEIGRSSQVVASTDEGLSVTRGTLKTLRKLDVTSKSLTVIESNSDGKASQVERTVAFNAAGLPTSLKITSGLDKQRKVLFESANNYNAEGLLESQTVNAQQLAAYEYDAYGRLIKQDNSGSVVSWGYSPFSNSAIATGAAITGADGVATTLGSQSLDALSRVVERTVNGNAQTFSYSSASLPGFTAEPAGPETMSGYTSGWDALTYTETCPVSDSIAGDSENQLSTVSRFSLRGRLLEMTDIGGNVTTYKYDVDGRISETSSAVCKCSFVFADDGRLKEETVEDLTNQRSMKVSYAYDLLGNETSRTFTCDGMKEHVVERTLKKDGRLEKRTIKIDGKEDGTENYEYDAQGRLVKWNSTDGGYYYRDGLRVNKQTYSYDALGNVVSTRPTQNYHSFPWGPKMDRTFAEGKPGLLQKQENETSIGSDSQGRWTNNRKSYHANGQVDCSQWHGPVYSTGTTRLKFGYDDLGRLRALFTFGNNDSPRGFQFHYREGKIYARSQVTTNSHMWNGVTQRKMILLNESPGCFLQQCCDLKKGTEQPAQYTFELRDATGTVFATLNGDGKLHYHLYSPYGQRWRGGEWEDWLGFKGEVLLPDETYYFGSYRAYDPKLMSFCSPDSWSPFGRGGPAAYAYCAGDPVNYHDPSGHQIVAQYQRQDGTAAMYSKEFRIAMAIVNVAVAPFTGGASLAVAVGATGLAMVSAGFDIASILLEDSDPELAGAFSVLGFGFGLASMGAGLAEGPGRIANNGARPSTAAVVSKRMGGESGFQTLSDDFRYFYDVHKGKPRIVLEGHGLPGIIQVEGKLLDAKGLLKYLDAKGVKYKGMEFKLHVCHSADFYDAGYNSLAGDLHLKLGVTVKGYEGELELAGLVGKYNYTDPHAFGNATTTKYHLDRPFEEYVMRKGRDVGVAHLQPRKLDWVYPESGNPFLKQYEYWKPVTYHANLLDPSNPLRRVRQYTPEMLMKRFKKNPLIYADPYAAPGSPPRLTEGELC